MAFLALKTLSRKEGTTSAILAVALLVAILASMSSIVNHINSQTEALSRIPEIGEAYLILSNNSTSITDSQVDVNLANLVSDSDVKYVIPQKVFAATLATNSSNHTAVVRAVVDVQTFFNVRNARVKGDIANANEMQANVGEILARLASINVGDKVSVNVGDKALKVKIVGIIQTQTQSDAELIIPMKLANHLFRNDDKVSLIEFAPKDPNMKDEVINHVTKLLPPNTKIIKVQQLKTFMQNVNNQTLSFLSLWSTIVYIVVIAASYVLATRLIAESSYDLAMLRALGAKKMLTFKLILTYTATTALLGSILGLALGIAGSQMASTAVRWMWPSFEISPFLEVGQALQILLLTFSSSIVGCVYPAFKSACKTYVEKQPL